MRLTRSLPSALLPLRATHSSISTVSLGGSGAPPRDAKWRRRRINFQHRAHHGGQAVERSIHLDEKVAASFAGRMRSQVILRFIAGASLPMPGPSKLTSEEKPRELVEDEIAVDTYVMKKDVRGTSRKPRAIRDEQ